MNKLKKIKRWLQFHPCLSNRSPFPPGGPFTSQPQTRTGSPGRVAGFWREPGAVVPICYFPPTSEQRQLIKNKRAQTCCTSVRPVWNVTPAPFAFCVLQIAKTTSLLRCLWRCRSTRQMLSCFIRTAANLLLLSETPPWKAVSNCSW